MFSITTIEELGKRINVIEERNRRVEVDKAWEIYWVRRVLLILFTYLSIWLYLMAIGVIDAWMHAIVPAVGFLLSTLTLPWFKGMWLRRKREA